MRTILNILVKLETVVMMILGRDMHECLHSIKFTLRSVFFINLSLTTGITLFMIHELPDDFLQYSNTQLIAFTIWKHQ